MKNYIFIYLLKILKNSSKFYSALFDAKPDKIKPDYIKWDLSIPPINFAISTGGQAGINHLGIEAEDSGELDKLYERISPIDAKKDDQGETVCCYSRSVKTWIDDPQGVSWELFHSLNDEEIYRDNKSSCCSTQECAC